MISYPIRGLYREHFMRFELASDEDANKILELYHSVLDTPYCRWSMEYPLIENIEDDLSRKGLFCLKEKAEIIAAISIDEDDAVAALPCWSNNLQPSIELSRLCVRSDYQGKGLAGKMIEHMMEYCRNNNIKSIHYLVSKYNLLAQKAYSRLDFKLMGECELYEDSFYCYEKEV